VIATGLVVLKTVPLAVMEAPPFEVIFPPSVAELCVMEDLEGLEIEGVEAAIVVTVPLFAPSE
jgi:hypothetical protein